MLLSRAGQRRNDPSDADADVIRLQRSQNIGEIWWSRIDASGSVASVLTSATNRVRDRLRDVVNERTSAVR